MIVVTFIIATLAALIMTAASGVIDRAKKAQAKNDITQIVTAVNAYYADYGKYPITDSRQATDAVQADPEPHPAMKSYAMSSERSPAVLSDPRPTP